MSGYHRVVWSEGMLLGPHHFQQAERHLLGEMDYRFHVAVPFAWGVRRIAIDEDALRNRRFQLRELEAVLPDGAAVRLPGIDPVPTGRDLESAFGPERSSLDVFLALPDNRPGIPRTRLPGTDGVTDSRYVSEGLPLHDENAPGPETEVLVARQNLHILVSGESLDGFTTLPIARLKKTEAGLPFLDPDFAPPSLSIQAAGPVPGIVVSVLENLSAKADVLASQTRQGGSKVQFGTSDVLLFWQLHTVNAVIPVLAHYRNHPDMHPVHPYLALARLAGALCTFASDRRAREVPGYDHENLGRTFRALEKMVRELSEISAPTRFDRVHLEKTEDGALLKGDVVDQRLFGSGYHWYLAVTGNLAEDRIRTEVPAKVTIGASHNVEFLVRMALRGVPVTHTAVPPNDFPIKAGHVYFRLENHGETWDTIAEARSIALYLQGAELKGLSYELIAMEA